MLTLRRLALLAVLITPVAVPQPASGQWLVGAQGGVAAFTVGGDAPEDSEYGRQGRLSAGVVLGRYLTPFLVLRFEPGLVQKGTAVAFEVAGVEDPVDSLSLSLDYVALPLVAQVFTAGGRGFVTAGVTVGVLTSASLATAGGFEEDVEAVIEGTDMSLMFGVGGLVLRERPSLGLELRYDQSLAKAFAGSASGATAALPNGFRSSGLQLLARLSWTLGGDR